MRRLKNYKPTRFMAETSHYDKAEADFVCTFIEQLKHTKGEFYQQPFELIDWQEQIIRDVFGILKPDGYRQFNTCYIEVPKKCGKSELAAAVALYMLCADGEQRAEVYGCAADREQASLVFDVACDMVKLADDALRRRCEIRPSKKLIRYVPTNSVYKALSSDVAGKSGMNVSALVFDELWVQKDKKFFQMMTVGTSDARKNPLHFIITTAGNDTNSICYELHQKAVDILEGRKFDPAFYPVIYGAGEDEDWTDPKVWEKANPSLGITIGVDKVEAACEQAKQNPAEENAFRQLRLNQWVKQEVRWMPMQKWDAFGRSKVLVPLSEMLKTCQSADTLTKIDELDMQLEKNMGRRQQILQFFTKGLLDPAVYAEENDALDEENARLNAEKYTLSLQMSGSREQQEALTKLLKYTAKGLTLTEFDSELFTEHVDHIVIYGRSEIGFTMKCGPVFQERIE